MQLVVLGLVLVRHIRVGRYNLFVNTVYFAFVLILFSLQETVVKIPKCIGNKHVCLNT